MNTRSRPIVAAILTGIALFGITLPADAAPPRPNGLTQIIATFGQACNSNAYAGTFNNVPYGSYTNPNLPSNWQFHSSITDIVQQGLVTILLYDKEALSYGSGMYICRKKKQTGGTFGPDWSQHAWGIAIDTNTAVNPQGQPFWNGTGHNGNNFGYYIPNVWASPTLNFYWGANFSGSSIDVMHFQYATGY
jgi:hypothetical protein